MADQLKAPISSEPKRIKSTINSFHLTETTTDEIVQLITKLIFQQNF